MRRILCSSVNLLVDLVDLESRVAASPIATTCTRGVVVIEKKDMVEEDRRYSTAADMLL